MARFRPMNPIHKAWPLNPQCLLQRNRAFSQDMPGGKRSCKKHILIVLIGMLDHQIRIRIFLIGTPKTDLSVLGNPHVVIYGGQDSMA